MVGKAQLGIAGFDGSKNIFLIRTDGMVAPGGMGVQQLVPYPGLSPQRTVAQQLERRMRRPDDQSESPLSRHVELVLWPA